MNDPSGLRGTSRLDRREVIPGGCLAVGGAVEFIETRGGLLPCGVIKERGRMVLDPWEQAAVEDVWRHLGFELGIADEEDDGAEAVFRKTEKRHQGADVEQILMQRILEAAFLTINLLRPLALFFGAEDPAFVVLGLDDEDAEG